MRRRSVSASTIKAGTYCELMTLSYESFKHIAEHFPDLQEHMLRAGGKHNDAPANNSRGGGPMCAPPRHLHRASS